MFSGVELDGVRIDPPEVHKGQTLTVADLEAYFGMKYRPQFSDSLRVWNFALLTLKRRIADSRKRRGLPAVTMHTPRGTLHVCTDAEAAEYNRSMGKRGIKRFRQSAERNAAVDITQLNDEQRRDHERAIRRQLMIATAIKNAGRNGGWILSDPPPRATPPVVIQSKDPAG